VRSNEPTAEEAVALADELEHVLAHLAPFSLSSLTDRRESCPGWGPGLAGTKPWVREQFDIGAPFPLLPNESRNVNYCADGTDTRVQ
jgi:hypothetical protein